MWGPSGARASTEERWPRGRHGRARGSVRARCVAAAPPPQAQASGWLGQGACGHLGALHAPVGARRCSGGHRITRPAEVAGVSEVEGRGPGVEAAEPEIVPLLVEGASELQQAVADAAPVVSAQRLLPNRLPCIIRDYSVVVEGRY